MTITTIYNASNLGSTTSLANQGVTKTTLTAGTTSVQLTARIATNDNLQPQSAEIEVCYIILPVSLTADATLPPNVAAGVKTLRCRLGMGKVDRYTISDPIPNNGGYLYTWWNSPACAPSGTAPTLTLYSTELP